MYLIAVEGGDGSGKGTAARMLGELAESEFSFNGVWLTEEPRRNHPLGRLAREAVQTGKEGPVAEAAYFAADRLAHSHISMSPKLEQGTLVISERQVFSSLVYQGVVGELGVEQVARLNSAALIPDLVVWVDCDQEVALKRISEGTLRSALGKQEYFETDALQQKIRDGYAKLLSKEMPIPPPFDNSLIVGPILNEGTQKEFKAELREVLHNFLKRHPPPLNLDPEVVNRNLLRRLFEAKEHQQRLPISGLPMKKRTTKPRHPYQVIRDAEKEYVTSFRRAEGTGIGRAPASLLTRSVLGITGVFSLLKLTDLSELRMLLGPVQQQSESQIQKVVRFLTDEVGCLVRENAPALGKTGARYQLHPEWIEFGRLALLVWPLKKALRDWRFSHPRSSWKSALNKVLANHSKAGDAMIERMRILSLNGDSDEIPNNVNELIEWWKGG